LIAGWSTSGAGGDKTDASRGSIDYWVAKVSGPNSITTSAIPSPACAGTNINVNYTVTGTFTVGNTFTALLSDSSGSFAAPVVIGTSSATVGGTIAASLPFVVAGSNYKIQVISNNPVANDIYSSASFQINEPQSYYPDADNDGYGDPLGLSVLSCTPIAGKVTNNGDCNDADPLVYALPAGNDGIVGLSSNCEGSSGNIFSCLPIANATSYQWILTPGLSSGFVNNITTDTTISISIALGALNDSIGVAGKNSCGLSDTLYVLVNMAPLPAAAGVISGDNQISSCTNQLGITYSVPAIPNATNYVWALPPTSSFVGNTDSNVVVVDYSAYGVSGTISVYGTNSCGVGPSSTLNISYKSIPKAEICGISVDSASQKGIIKWQRPLESSADSIVVLRKNTSTLQYEKIATLNNVSPGEYTDSSAQSNPDLKAETYKLAIKDSCGNIGDSSIAVLHRTIYLYGLTGWASIPKLYWTPYEGISDTGRYYNVLRDSSGSGPFKIIKDSIKYNDPLNYTDPDGVACLTCRYVVELVYSSDCNPNLRVMANRSTSRSNVANRAAMPFDSLLTEIGKLAEEIKFSIQPNPAHENIILTFKETKKHIELELLNMLGEKVYFESFSDIEVNSKRTIYTESLPRGVYLLKLSSKGNSVFTKIVLY